MNCKKVQFLMCLYLADDPALTAKERLAFTNHLRNCQECAREYEESKFVIDLVKKYWPISEDTLALIEKADKYVKPRMTIEEGWEDLKSRIPELAQLEKRRKRLQLFRRVGAVAACLAVAISIFLAFSSSKLEIAQESVTEQVVFAPKPSIKVELVSQNNSIIIPAGKQIVSADALKTLVINEKHRMVLNSNTTLSIEPLLDNERVGCMVKLGSGEIFTHVEHDSNPFIVSTAHGKAVITGTTFDIKATNHNTTLVVADGNVRFESEEGFVEVAAGYTSEIAGQSTPTKPATCNTAELTAWATGHELKTALAKIGSFSDDYDLTDLWLSAMSGPINLEDIDYEDWVEKKRDWFKREFPWIFQLKDALARENIEFDYPELLIKSGDVSQFICFDVAPARFSVIEPDSLLKTASDYGFDKQWLLENVPVAKSTLEKLVLSENSFTDLAAFERWLDYLDETKGLEPLIPIYSYHASKYLAETRSLIWFAVRDGKYDLTDEERKEVLALLQEEVTAACKCQNDVLYPPDEQNPSCGEEICQEPIDPIVGHIKTMKAVEERIEKYEIDK